MLHLEEKPGHLHEALCTAAYTHKAVSVEAQLPETLVPTLSSHLKPCVMCTMLRPLAAHPARWPLLSRAPGSSLLAFGLFSLLLGLCQSVENKCSSSNAATCTKCLAVGPECGWCTQEDFMVDSVESERCDTVFNLRSKGCRADSIEHPSVQLQIVNSKEANSQVTPAEVSVHLRPGASVNFLLRMQRLEKYPLDLYYLVDVSASMITSIEKLNAIGSDLSQKMADFSHDIRFGFGSFVDKPVSPYISIHPERLKNQCSVYNKNCMPPHGFIHVLSLTNNITQFKQIVSKQKISGNIDDPEGAFDAMLQAAVCHKEIGWRKEAKRLIILMTDQTSHLALDSKLAGIVSPNDGNCHLKDNVYTRASDMRNRKPKVPDCCIYDITDTDIARRTPLTHNAVRWDQSWSHFDGQNSAACCAIFTINYGGICDEGSYWSLQRRCQEHPSLGLLGEKLADNHVYGLFAVRGRAFDWYKDILPLLPGTVAKKLDATTSNIKNVVVEAYQALLSEMRIQVDNPMKGIYVNITAICPDGSRRSGVEGCRNVQSNDKVLFNVSVAMDTCDVEGGHNYIILKPIGFNETAKIKIYRSCRCQCNSPPRRKDKCVTEVHPDCPGVPCRDSDCSSGEKEGQAENCKQSASESECSGRGTCLCGKCYCSKTKLGKIYGKYCEIDNFSCPYNLGKLCSGNGECNNGDCKCHSGWEGDRCQCSSSKKHCMDANGLVCSGRGTCTCGECVCASDKSFGPLCQYCSGCSNTCTDNWNCEHSHGSLNGSVSPTDPYKTKCNTLVYYIDQTSECFSDPWILKIFFIIFTATFLIGFLSILIIRVSLLQCSNNRRTSSSDYRVPASMKDKNGLHSMYSRTVTYTREKPDDININGIGKLAVHEAFKYKF